MPHSSAVGQIQQNFLLDEKIFFFLFVGQIEEAHGSLFG
jgi:hypothetical protein